MVATWFADRWSVRGVFRIGCVLLILVSVPACSSQFRNAASA